MTWTEYDVDGVPYRQNEVDERLQVWTQTEHFAGWVDVPGHGAQLPARRETASPVVQMPQLPPMQMLPAQTVHTVKETSRDRAQAFVIKIRWVAGVTGLAVGGLVWAVGAPATWAVVSVFVAFAAVFLIAHRQHLNSSPEANAKYVASRYMDIIDRHSRDASDLFRKENGLDK